MLTFDQAREKITEELSRLVASSPLPKEAAPLNDSIGRTLANEIRADRLYPPFDRSIRDGFAVRAAEIAPGARLRCIGELKAGDTPRISVTPGTCIQIMTGAAVPKGADAVVMVEHTSSEGDTIVFSKTIEPGQHLVRRGREAAEGQLLVARGARIGFTEVAVAAQVGEIELQDFRKPRVAILSTGDAVVPAETKTGDFPIR